jgi:large conductance mechanosensitive channel
MANPARSLAADFRAFLTRGNVIELAIAFMLGVAFGDVVKSAVADLIAPIIGIVFGDLNFVDYFAVLREGKTAGPYATLEAARAAGAVTLNWGQFVTRVISFLITAFVLFMIVRYVMNLHRRQQGVEEAAAPTTKDCPFCYSKIPVHATRCPQCTSSLEVGSVPAA